MKIDIDIEENNIKYDILIEKNILSNINLYINPNEKLIIFVDNKLSKNKIDLIFKDYQNKKIVYLNTSEQLKNLDTYQNLINECLSFQINRNDTIIGIGGGVTLDIIGFVSSTYLRGVKYISIPTTTLSQIDSCLGNKVGLNHNGIKNMIGAFYSPSLVLIDTNILVSLDSKHYVYGIMEALKVGLLCDEKIVDLIEEDIFLNIDEIIYRSLKVKQEIVTIDLYEKRLRKILNFGHTIGHGIESMYLDKLYHGQCVAIGMLYMIKDNDLRKRIIKIYDKLNIEYDLNIDKDKIMEYIKYDKKSINNEVEIITLNKINEYQIEKVSLEDIKLVIEEGYYV